MLTEGYAIRPLAEGDGPALARAHRRNRAHLEPWDPDRPESFWTDHGQQEYVADALRLAAEDTVHTYLLWHAGEVVGRAMLTNIVRGHMQSGTLGYWVDHEHQGRGLATALAEHVAREATRIGLHRIEAGTMVDNLASQAVLRRAGFREYGTAEKLLFIRGAWRDHVLFERLLHDDPPA